MTFSTHKINAIIFNYETFFICHENEKEGIVECGYVFCGSEVHQKWFRIVVYKRGKWGRVKFWNGSKLIGFFDVHCCVCGLWCINKVFYDYKESSWQDCCELSDWWIATTKQSNRQKLRWKNNSLGGNGKSTRGRDVLMNKKKERTWPTIWLDLITFRTFDRTFDSFFCLNMTIEVSTKGLLCRE